MSKFKALLGNLPYTAELYWRLRQKESPTTVGMNLTRLREVLPDWVAQASEACHPSPPGKNVLVFGMIRYWIEHTTLLGLTLAGLGHRVTLAYLPFAHWRKPENRFDLRRQNLYIREVLRPIEPLVKVVSFYDLPFHNSLPAALETALRARAFRDTQYSMLMEEVERDSELYRLRLERDTAAAQAALTYLQNHHPEVIIIPNGSILEFGVVYEVARYLDIPVVTYEFGEQDQRIWLAQNGDVMRQETDALWAARGGTPLSEEEKERIHTLFASRRGARLWATFARQWQGVPSQGGERLRNELGLDQRPLAFLPTNVLGDSLTLGRDIFSPMTEWLRRTIRWFGEHPQFQLVIRVHPGEQIGWGPSVYDILQESFPQLPENIRLLPASAKVNSYDLAAAAQVGLVYTTTLGMEMAMSGKPVIVTGQTHYRNKGFTLDPDSWEAFFRTLEEVLRSPENFHLSKEQTELAWRYAYRFFFEYPQPFPWHIQHFWKGLEEWPLKRVLSEEGMREFGKTFAFLTRDKVLFESKIEDQIFDPQS